MSMADDVEDNVFERTQMTDRELDAECARIIGCQVICMCDNKAHGRGGILKPYSTSLDACRELLEWVRTSAGKKKFLMLVEQKVLNRPISEYWVLQDMFAFLLTTPRQIAEAFVECFGGEK